MIPEQPTEYRNPWYRRIVVGVAGLTVAGMLAYTYVRNSVTNYLSTFVYDSTKMQAGSPILKHHLKSPDGKATLDLTDNILNGWFVPGSGHRPGRDKGRTGTYFPENPNLNDISYKGPFASFYEWFAPKDLPRRLSPETRREILEAQRKWGKMEQERIDLEEKTRQAERE